MRPFSVRYRWAVVLTGVAALAALGTPGAVRAHSPIVAVQFPSVGFDPASQAVRVTVVNPSENASWAVVSFCTAAGRPQKHASLSVGPRATACFDLTGDDLGGVTGRTQVWAAVKSRDTGLRAGMEVYDTATGGTTIRYDSPKDVSEGNERVIFPSVGVTPDQAVRVTVVNPSYIVSRSAVVFFDAAGNTLKRTELVLHPRQIGWVDLSPCELASVAGRAQVRAEVFASEPDQRPGVEVFGIAACTAHAQPGDPKP